ncbi:MAG: PorT family protein [Muribaculaceae bacterium]|nr:PorT family protein [Muribaculaceae bacterium]
MKNSVGKFIRGLVRGLSCSLSCERSVAFAVLTIFSSSPLLAQTHYNPNVSIGVKGGIDLPRVFFNPSVKQKFPIGATFGFQFRYIEENHFGLIAELNYSQRGWAENYPETTLFYRRSIDYLEVPVLAHIYFGRRGRFFFNAGPQVGFKIGEGITSNFDYENVETVPDYPNKGRTHSELTNPIEHKIDFGIAAGIGGEYSINRKNAVSLEARFYYGIGNIFPAGHQDPFRASNTMCISATIGYWFRIK